MFAFAALSKKAWRPAASCVATETKSAVLCVHRLSSRRPFADIHYQIPQELLGAAQKLWNSYTAHVVLDEWSGLQRWRIVNCFEECTSAFRKTYEVIVNPYRNTAMDIIGAQHLESLSKNMLVMMRQLVRWTPYLRKLITDISITGRRRSHRR